MNLTLISTITDYENYKFDKKSEVIFTIDDKLYELTEYTDKLYDIMKMPNYIKNDWFKYNGLPLSENVLDKHIEFSNMELMHEQARAHAYPKNNIDKLKENLNYLKVIKRNFRIDGIIGD